jgi:hypothetical protein
MPADGGKSRHRSVSEAFLGKFLSKYFDDVFLFAFTWDSKYNGTEGYSGIATLALRRRLAPSAPIV